MERIFVNTQSHTEFVDLTRELKILVARHAFKDGMVHLFVPHTTAALTLNDNINPDVQYDILCALNVAAPWMQPHFRNPMGNSAAHVKAGMMGFTLALFVENGDLVLGPNQGVLFCEFDGPQQRQVWVRMEASKNPGNKYGRSNPM